MRKVLSELSEEELQGFEEAFKKVGKRYREDRAEVNASLCFALNTVAARNLRFASDLIG